MSKEKVNQATLKRLPFLTRKSSKRLKTAIAATLIVAISTANLIPVSATTVGRPSKKKKAIEITFQAGEGGYFAGISDEDLVSTKSNASKSNGLKSGTDRKEWVQSFYDLEKDDEGYFTNLQLAAKEAEDAGKEPVWQSIENQANSAGNDKYVTDKEMDVDADESEENHLAFAGWYYYNHEYPILVSGYKEIYSDSTLVGEWYNPNQIEGEIADNYQLAAIGLNDRKLTISKTDDGQSSEELAQWIDKALSAKSLEMDGNGIFAFKGLITGKGKPVTITMTVPEEQLDPMASISVIHEKSKGNLEVLPTDIVKADSGDEYRMTFAVNEGGSFYLVNTQERRKVLDFEGEEVFDDLELVNNEPLQAAAETVKSGEFGDGLSWKLDDDGTLTISGKGKMPDWDHTESEKIPWNALKRDIEKIVIEEGITTVGRWAFYFCMNLVSVEIPGSLTSIGSGAFYGCVSLADINLPDSVITIESGAFTDCSNLKNAVPLARGVCDGGLKWELNQENVLTISGEGLMPDWDSFATPWYSLWSDIKKVIIKPGVTNIGKRAFFGCTNLESAEIPGSVTDIGEAAFQRCDNLKNVEMADGVANIGSYAFSVCKNLEKIKLPESMVNIGSYAFNECVGLSSMELPDQVANLESYAFNGCSGLTTIKLSKGMTTIKSNSFSGCTGLTRITIPENVVDINSYAFDGCSALANVELSNNIRYIKRYAFCGTAITSVVIPESVVFLGQRAFPEGTDFTYRKLGNESSSPIPGTGKTRFISTENEHDQNYDTYGRVINSYLFEGGDGRFYRAEYTHAQVIIEQYNADYTFAKSWSVSREMSKFGGFYAGADAFYMVFGQDNLGENDETEVIRIVKYSKDMERLSSVSLYGANTIRPFDFCSLRMEEKGDYLYIRTAHGMYKSGDGINHQANLTIIVNQESMILAHYGVLVTSNEVGYVSHSFNQFIKIDGDVMVTVDQGDAYPREVVMTVCPADDVLFEPITSTLLSIPGETGDNYTGISLGGVEYSDSSYLAAGNTVDMGNFGYSDTRNIFLIVVNKDDLTGEPDYIRVTDYEEGGTYSASTPQLVKLSDNIFAVMWEEMTGSSSTSRKVKIAFFDGNGNWLNDGNIDDFTGSLSDCQPVILNGNVTWYVTDGKDLTFYMYPAGLPDSAQGIQVDKKTLKGPSSSSGGGGSSGGSGGSGGGGSSGGSGGSGGGGSSGGGGRVSGSSGGPGASGGNSPGFAPSLTGRWIKDNIGWWFQLSSGGYPRNQWARINDVIYRFNEKGYMAEGWFFLDGKWYYLMPGSGAMATGWIYVANTWYYLNMDGSMAVGWIQISGKWYYLRSDGAMLANTVTPDGYVVGVDGAWIE